MNDPIEQLCGAVTADGWTVSDKIVPGKECTGGAFSVGYIAADSRGRLGYFKALDFRKALGAADPARELQSMTSAYNFERDVLARCADDRLDRVVTAISSGALDAPGAPLSKIFYLIFELADGDVRKQIRASKRYEPAWSMNAMHHIAVGLQQLHSRGIYHQDIKPSNVLVFDQGTLSKLADLGRAFCQSFTAPHDELLIPGALSYAPPEQLYRFEARDRVYARQAADLYLLGSMLFFLFTGTGLSSSTAQYLRLEHRPQRFAGGDTGWRGSFRDVLPYYREAQSNSMSHFHQIVHRQLGSENEKVTARIVAVLNYLTEPDLELRGHPSARRMAYDDPLSLERFVSELQLVSKTLKLQKRA